MAKVKQTNKDGSSSDKIRPALTPEAKQNQMISMAEDLAMKWMMDGTAPSQVVTHYLKLATMRERLEIEKLKKENELLVAKAKAIESTERSAELYERAIKAMRLYSGQGDPDEY